MKTAVWSLDSRGATIRPRRLCTDQRTAQEKQGSGEAESPSSGSDPKTGITQKKEIMRKKEETFSFWHCWHLSSFLSCNNLFGQVLNAFRFHTISSSDPSLEVRSLPSSRGMSMLALRFCRSTVTVVHNFLATCRIVISYMVFETTRNLGWSSAKKTAFIYCMIYQAIKLCTHRKMMKKGSAYNRFHTYN